MRKKGCFIGVNFQGLIFENQFYVSPFSNKKKKKKNIIIRVHTGVKRNE